MAINMILCIVPASYAPPTYCKILMMFVTQPARCTTCRGGFRVGTLGAKAPPSKFYYEQGRKLTKVVVQMQLHFYTCMENEKIEKSKRSSWSFPRFWF